MSSLSAAPTASPLSCPLSLIGIRYQEVCISPPTKPRLSAVTPFGSPGASQREDSTCQDVQYQLRDKRDMIVPTDWSTALLIISVLLRLAFLSARVCVGASASARDRSSNRQRREH